MLHVRRYSKTLIFNTKQEVHYYPKCFKNEFILNRAPSHSHPPAASSTHSLLLPCNPLPFTPIHSNPRPSTPLNPTHSSSLPPSLTNPHPLPSTPIHSHLPPLIFYFLPLIFNPIPPMFSSFLLILSLIPPMWSLSYQFSARILILSPKPTHCLPFQPIFNPCL